MRCPCCGNPDTQVKDSRPTEDIGRSAGGVSAPIAVGASRRSSGCSCANSSVIKRNGRRVPFDRDKLMRSVQISLRKRPVEPERIEAMVQQIVRELESMGEAEVSSETIGELVMEGLRKLDDVAYVRFASVYRDFREPKDFEIRARRIVVRRNAASGVNAQVSACSASAEDLRYMKLALALGRRGQGLTAPNPAVGAVLVKDGVIVGRGWTRAGGRPHAEVEALRRAGEAARGATLYVTLEPCSHHGRSSPCADAVIAAGVTRVVSTIEDVNPRVAGEGHARLRAAGIAVDIGLCRDEALHDHDGHIRVMRDGRPHVTLKFAVSSDGMIGAAGRKPVALTGEAATASVHLLRAHHDAILIGIGTAIADDPLLTCRLPGMASRSPIRIVLDPRLHLPASSRLVQSARETPLWVAGTGDSSAIERHGAEIVAYRKAADLPALLGVLGQRGITRLLVEGGAKVAASFLKADLVDEVRLYTTPKTIGPDGVPAIEARPLTDLTASPRWRVRATETLGPDVLTVYERA